jgi:hypothetical protein
MLIRQIFVAMHIVPKSFQSGHCHGTPEEKKCYSSLLSSFTRCLATQKQFYSCNVVLPDNRPVRLAYQPPASSTFLSEEISHQQPANSTFLSKQISTSHQPPANRTG